MKTVKTIIGRGIRRKQKEAYGLVEICILGIGYTLRYNR
jgi:hypothetical protein